MGRKEELQIQSSGFIDIFKKSFLIIYANPKIFIKITLSFIFPLSCFSIIAYYIDLFHPPTNLIPTPFNNNGNNTLALSPASSSEPSKLILYVFKLLIFKVLSLVLSFMSISTIVYSVACIHTGTEITFRKAMGIIPKVWKRVLYTFLANWSLFMVISLFYMVVLVSLVLVLSSMISSTQLSTSIGISIGLIIASFSFLVVIFCLSIIFVLGYVISILEDCCGMKALRKSKELVEAKMRTTIAVILVSMICTAPSLFFLMKLMGIDGNSLVKVCYGILIVSFTTLNMLVTQVVQTVLYFVCKSYHHEPIDEKSLVSGYVEIFQFDEEGDLKV